MHRDKVFVEIGRLLGVEDASSATPGWFGHRMTAMKNVIKNMSDDELQSLDTEVDRISKQGYPEKLQRK